MTNLEKALWYVADGWAVLPLRVDKTPYLPEGTHKKYLYAAASEEDVRAFWKKYPDAQIGLACGKVSGRTVIDIDDGEDIFPETKTVRTPSGGTHKIYQYSAAVGNGVGTYYQGIDTRNDGGYIVGAGSHCTYVKKGKKIDGVYKIIDDSPLSPFPESLFKHKLGKIEKFDYKKLLGVTEGSRNASAASVIGLLLRQTPQENLGEAWEVAKAWNSKNVPPISEEELRAVFDSIASKELSTRTGIYQNITRVEDVQVEQSHEDITLAIPIKEGRVLVSLTEIQLGYKEFEATASFRVETTAGNLPTFERNINTNSASAVTDLRRSLESAYKEAVPSVNWTLLLNRAFTIGKATYLDSDDVRFLVGETMEDTPFLLEPFLQENGPNMLFGDGGTGKSYFALRMAASLAVGRDFFHIPIEKNGTKTIWLDYEGGGPKKFVSRLTRIAEGMKVPYDTLAAHIGHYQPRGSVLDIRTQLIKLIKKHGISLIILDAGASASGSNPNDEGAVIKMFSALDRLPVTKLIIHHEPKESGTEDKKAYYGTTFWNNLSRSTHRLITETKEDKWKKVIKVIHTKSNDSYEHDPFMYRMTINKPTEPAFAEFMHIDPATFGGVKEKILHELSLVESLTRNQIAESIGEDPNYVKNQLILLKRDNLVEFDGNGRNSKWKITNAGRQKSNDF